MKLKTGNKVKFPLEFDNGDKDYIYFDPCDPDLPIRLITSKDRISEKIEAMKIDDFELGKDGEVAVPKDFSDFENMTDEQIEAILNKSKIQIKIMEDTKKIIYDELDYAFNSDVSATVFKHCSPFAIIDGEYYVGQFFRGIAPEIQKYTQKSNEELEKKMSKHIRKYIK